MRFTSAFAVASVASAAALAAPNKRAGKSQKVEPSLKRETNLINSASPTATDPADVYAAQATALTLSPTSNVKGKV